MDLLQEVTEMLGNEYANDDNAQLSDSHSDSLSDDDDLLSANEVWKITKRLKSFVSGAISVHRLKPAVWQYVQTCWTHRAMRACTIVNVLFSSDTSIIIVHTVLGNWKSSSVIFCMKCIIFQNPETLESSRAYFSLRWKQWNWVIVIPLTMKRLKKSNSLQGLKGSSLLLKSSVT